MAALRRRARRQFAGGRGRCSARYLTRFANPLKRSVMRSHAQSLSYARAAVAAAVLLLAASLGAPAQAVVPTLNFNSQDGLQKAAVPVRHRVQHRLFAVRGCWQQRRDRLLQHRAHHLDRGAVSGYAGEWRVAGQPGFTGRVVRQRRAVGDRGRRKHQPGLRQWWRWFPFAGARARDLRADAGRSGCTRRFGAAASSGLIAWASLRCRSQGQRAPVARMNSWRSWSQPLKQPAKAWV